MKLGIMQPYFLPYIGYFQLINAVDRYIIYDDANYIKQGWINRNRILMNGEPYIFRINLSGASSNKKINEIGLGNNRKKVFKTIRESYSKAPFYKQGLDLLSLIFSYNTTNLSDFIINSIIRICQYLKINTEILISSYIEKDDSCKGEEKVIEICKLFNADTYINAIGGLNLYDSMNFQNNGIKLLFLNSFKIHYKQFSSNFIQNLSIVDVLMFNNINEISGMLSQYNLITNDNFLHQ
ncbi:MAG TPA: WbqC family protein [Prolixibacteraceae bacterium]|jgi:hypothetical protein|nr:WbqC family protein [Prolixibacteraceae bacterium]HOG96604.1 WbqC family protein [Prolixibacteraceae bacterium]HQB27337.1 WbqC family protein [Paludibacter sp.]